MGCVRPFALVGLVVVGLAAGVADGFVGDGGGRRVRVVVRPFLRLSLGGTPIEMVAAPGSVWVSVCRRDCSSRRSAGELVDVDARTGQIIHRVSTIGSPSFAIGDGALWIADFWAGTVRRIDPATGRATLTVALRLPRPVARGDRRFLPDSISVGRASVWVATARGWLADVDPRSGRVVSMTLAPADVTGDVAAGRDAVWVAESSLGVGVLRSPARRLTLRWLRDGNRAAVAAGQVVLGGGRVWISGEVAAGASQAGGGVLTGQVRLVVLDQQTGRIVHRVTLRSDPYQVAYGSGHLFLADARSGELSRVDTRYGIERLASLRGPGALIAVTPGAVWASTPSGALQRIATRTESETPIGARSRDSQQTSVAKSLPRAP